MTESFSFRAGILCALAFLASILFTRLILHLAIQHKVLDVPNDRSSHRTPTPRGGGLAIVICVLVGVTALILGGILSSGFWLAYIAGGLLIAGVGALDDIKPLPASMRLLCHFAAAIIGVVAAGGLPSIWLGSVAIHLGFVGALLAVVAIVWLTNLYNFMDGIDGIAGTQAIAAGIGGGLILLLTGQSSLALVSMLVGASAAGFLAWNWPPARIFMGDVGSGFLGFTFGMVALVSERSRQALFALYLLPLLPFVFDATATLIARYANGKSPTQPHRDHAYQKAVRIGQSHRTVTLMYGILAVIGVGGAAIASQSTINSWLVWGVFLMVLSAAYAAVNRQFQNKH